MGTGEVGGEQGENLDFSLLPLQGVLGKTFSVQTSNRWKEESLRRKFAQLGGDRPELVDGRREIKRSVTLASREGGLKIRKRIFSIRT